MEGHVEQPHHLPAPVQVIGEDSRLPVPVLPHGVENLARLLAEFLEPVEKIRGADMFHRVQVETVGSRSIFPSGLGR